MTTQKPTEKLQRVDVFSASSGVGKTSLAIRLAQVQAQHAGAPVLVVDADICGPCLGDTLESWASPCWDSQYNLVHLICGRPEYLPEYLHPGTLPVYRMRNSRPAEAKQRAPELVTAAIEDAALLFCPSHPRSTNPSVERVVLDNLLVHESVGGWIRYVIHQVVRQTCRMMRLAGVIVDHAPTMGALQAASLLECADQPIGGNDHAERRSILLTTQKMSALATAGGLSGWLWTMSDEIRRGSSSAPDLLDRIVWVVSRIPSGDGDWKQTIKKRYPRSESWLERALPLHTDIALAETEPETDWGLPESAHVIDDLETIRKAIFG